MTAVQDRFLMCICKGIDIHHRTIQKSWQSFLVEFNYIEECEDDYRIAMEEFCFLITDSALNLNKPVVFCGQDDRIVSLSALELAIRLGRHEMARILFPILSPGVNMSAILLLTVERMLADQSQNHMIAALEILEWESGPRSPLPPRPIVDHGAVAYSFRCAAAAGFTPLVNACLYRWRSSLVGNCRHVETLVAASKVVFRNFGIEGAFFRPSFPPPDFHNAIREPIELQELDLSRVWGVDNNLSVSYLNPIVEDAIILAGRYKRVAATAEILRGWPFSRNELIRIVHDAFDTKNDLFILQLLNFYPYLRQEVMQPIFCKSQSEALILRSFGYRENLLVDPTSSYKIEVKRKIPSEDEIDN